MIDKETQKAVDMFYSIYSEFYKKCGDRNMEIQLACALCGVKVPELETFSFFCLGIVDARGINDGRER